MNRIHTFGAGILILVLFGFAACAKSPTAEIDAANAALARAEADADAREYAPESISRAQDLVSRMQAENDAKRYDTAKSLAQQAVAAADTAIKDGAEAKVRARSDADSAITSAKADMTEAKKSLNGAKSLPAISLNVPSVERDLNVAEQTISGAESDFAEEAYLTAIGKAQDARSDTAEIMQRISAAVQAATRRK